MTGDYLQFLTCDGETSFPFFAWQLEQGEPFLAPIDHDADIDTKHDNSNSRSNETMQNALALIVFRCVLASLYEGVSVCPPLSPSDGP